MTSDARKVPSGRLSRLGAFGQLAAGVAGGVVAEGARRLAQGERPTMSDLLLTPANAVRVTEQLSRLRGAAMKLGQMISLDAGDMLPAELTQILARLRDAAHIMPPTQLEKVLATSWGPGWRRRFRRFDARPVAAASIGQVHRAELPDGRVLAIKVQYPGVARSIDSDVDNVATLLKVSGLLPSGLDLAPLLTEAKRQLHEEADYLREAAQMSRYADLLADDPAFLVPRPAMDLTGRHVLAMDFIAARSIDTLGEADQDVRNRAMAALLGLVLREVFDFGFMQTDPNFANYRWQEATGKIVLLDFGAARPVAERVREGYAALVHSGLHTDKPGLCRALIEIGFLSENQFARHGPALDRIIDTILGLLDRADDFDFADRRFTEQIRAEVPSIASDRASWHIPPAETLFVQRKISGTIALAVRMKARLPVKDMVARYDT
ncbi:ABC-1 domain-containing protein [Novosphingobium nitrogenifigens DSM 19370]|uniref:ABC-1 domain-containing protein n=1 Tax=Novosphingobium nitrogenifigens DSM 19370 TaxID=983920 RepID=F1ZAQ8_9SPHN|nr:AarF/ABC1/UbiB kinase family protein [Novosphingobium nitrogenifigens]EGD58305.1 ABC-1 domain-containing protein [Novosphingobium nitrogenifigens DSM 19370]